MAFDLLEKSRFSGRPVRLFVFTRQALVWRFANSDRDLVVGENTYLAARIDRSEIQQTAERAKDEVTITFPYLLDPAAPEYPVTQALGDNWRPYVPIDVIGVVCMVTHYGDTDAPKVEWIGHVSQPKFGDVEMQLVCEPNSSVPLARNQGAKFQVGCWKTPYSAGLRGCNMAPVDFRVTGTLTTVAGLSLTAAEFAASAFALAGGYLTYTAANGLLIRRGIESHTLGSDTLTLSPGGPNPAAGDAVVALPTCPRTWAACEARSNTDNYGGAIYRPRKTPDGVSMSWG